MFRRSSFLFFIHLFTKRGALTVIQETLSYITMPWLFVVVVVVVVVVVLAIQSNFSSADTLEVRGSHYHASLL